MTTEKKPSGPTEAKQIRAGDKLDDYSGGKLDVYSGGKLDVYSGGKLDVYSGGKREVRGHVVHRKRGQSYEIEISSASPIPAEVGIKFKPRSKAIPFVGKSSRSGKSGKSGRVAGGAAGKRVRDQIAQVDDPVAVYDAMWEAGTSLMGSYVWLAEHATDPGEVKQWRAAYAAVYRRRKAVDARSIPEQRAVMAGFIAEERALSHVVSA